MSGWQQALVEGGVEGALLKFVKGGWFLGGSPAETGPDGLRLVVLMPTALHGAIRWTSDHKVAERRLIPYETGGMPSKGTLEDGWSPNTSFQVVGASGLHAGIVATFCGTSWGARNALHELAAPYARKGEREFPIVTLSAQERKSGQYSVVEPRFPIVDWAPRANYEALLPPLEEKIALPLPAPKPIGDIIDDEIPF
jgi:hypothetical protein